MGIRIRHSWLAVALLLGISVALPSCEVGPAYAPPAVPVPTTFKSATTQEAATLPHLGRDWWHIFKDPKLDELMENALAANPSLQAAMARVAEARASTRAVQSQFYPVITANPALTYARASTSGGSGRGGGSNNPGTAAAIPLDLSYEVDLWGRIRRSVESSEAQTQSVVTDLEVVRQTLLADVAVDYFTLRSLDAQDQIFTRNVALYRRQLALTQQRLDAGIVSPTDVYQAQTLLESTVALQLEIRRQRADVEHAIAILLGRPPADLTLAPRPLDLAPPVFPVGMPGALLRRRPDVAEAEQNLVASNALVGVAIANFYPVLRLTGLAGFESINVQNTLDWQSRVWSIGPSLSVPIFEGGQLAANLDLAKARYQELVANYRTTVLGAFRDVEDALTDLHLRADAADAQARAVNAARAYVRLTQIQYDQGIISYLQVIDADRTLLGNEITAAQILNARMGATVLLIKALGGGWENPAPWAE